MPHSSGGGSHGGGSHGGGFHGGHSSRSHGSSGPMQRISKTQFPGSRRYMYYRKHRPEYFYSNYDPTKKKSKWRYLLILFYLPFYLAGITILASGIHNPVKLEMDYDTRILISDRAGLLGDTGQLQAALEAFQDTTGITPMVMTVNNEEWDSNYANLESYAYDLYVNLIPDESHWLIVYSQPEYPDISFNDWYWEGMQGDDTDNILTETVCNEFNKNFHEYITARNFYTIEQAYTKAFNELTPIVMERKIHFDWNILVFLIVWYGFVTFHMCAVVGINPFKRKYRKAVLCPEDAKEDTCDYCGGVYIVGSHLNCPHCGAPVPIHKPFQPETLSSDANDDGLENTGSGFKLNGEEYRV